MLSRLLVSMCACVHVSSLTFTPTRTYARVGVGACVCAYRRVRVGVCVFVCVYMRVYVSAWVHVFICA